MKATWSAIALAAVLGFGPAHAKEIFIEGDIVRGNQPGAPGPICVLNNQFKHLEKIVFRFRVLDKDGKVLDNKSLKGISLDLPDGQKVDGYWGGHPPQNPTDFFWVVVWIVPKDYPNGTFMYRATATDMKGNKETWEPFKRVTSFLQIAPGEIEFAKK
jgi:hypothetical protein